MRENALTCGRNEVPRNYKLYIWRAAQLAGIDELQELLDAMHKYVGHIWEGASLKEIEARDAKMGAVNPRFCVGDLVLVGDAGKCGYKLPFRWRASKIHKKINGKN